MPDINIQTGFYQDVSIPLADKRLINLYPQVPQSPAFSEIALIGTPGTSEFLDTLLDGPSRGRVIANEIPYYVIRNNFVELAEDGTFINRGTISGTSSNVSMAYNGKTIAIVDPTGASYFYTVATNNLAQITDPVFLGMGQVRTVAYKLDFFVFSTDIEFFNSSAVSTNNGQSFDALDFGVANISPDNITAVWTNHNQLYILGTRTTEIFQNIQTTGFPFARVPGANIEIGCSARTSIVQFANSFAFIGAGENELPSIWMVSDSTPTKISTSAIDQILHGYSKEEISNAIGDVHAQDGNFFATWTVGDNTFRYDLTTSALLELPTWHEIQTGNNSGFGFQRWRGQHIIKAFGLLLTGDVLTGKIGKLDPDHFFEFGDRIQRVVRSQPFGGGPVFSSKIQLFIEAGVGNTDSTDPAWLFRYSDNGKTFTNPIPRKMGKKGDFGRQLVWNRMGRFPVSRVIQWDTDDPVKIAILKAAANSKGGR